MKEGIVVGAFTNQNSSQLRFSVGSGKDAHEVLRLEPEGKIVWIVKGEEIVVEEKSLLAIALLDLVIQFTRLGYDYSKLDPELYKRYKDFLETKKNKEAKEVDKTTLSAGENVIV